MKNRLYLLGCPCDRNFRCCRVLQLDCLCAARLSCHRDNCHVAGAADAQQLTLPLIRKGLDRRALLRPPCFIAIH
jgi:hypothetical protein